MLDLHDYSHNLARLGPRIPRLVTRSVTRLPYDRECVKMDDFKG